MACSRARITRALRAKPRWVRCALSHASWAAVGLTLIGCRCIDRDRCSEPM